MIKRESSFGWLTGWLKRGSSVHCYSCMVKKRQFRVVIFHAWLFLTILAILRQQFWENVGRKKIGCQLLFLSNHLNDIDLEATMSSVFTVQCPLF